MVVFNYSTRELTTKIVYYGPGLCGKTTNLQFIYDHMPQGVRGKMLSLATKSDRTLFFDFLPIDLGQIQGMKTKVQLYTVPGQVFYNETRRLVLKGADGVVFVADSQENMLEANLDSFRNLEDNLAAHGLSLADTPHVLQYNKQDLPTALPVEVLNEKLNRHNAPFYEAIATTGVGVQETLRHITKLVLLRMTDRYASDQRMSPRPPATPVDKPAPKVPEQVAPALPPVQDLPPARPAAIVSPAPPTPTASFSLEEAFAPTASAPPAPAASASKEPAPGSAWSASLDDLLAAPPGQAPAQAAPAPAPPPTVAPPPPVTVAPPVAAQAAPAPVRVAASAARAMDDDDVLGVSYSAPLPGKTQKIDMHDLDTVFGGDVAPAAHASRSPVAVARPVAVEVGPDDPLFRDETVERTRLVPGEPQEILVPLEVETGSGTTKLFRLTIRMELAP